MHVKSVCAASTSLSDHVHPFASAIRCSNLAVAAAAINRTQIHMHSVVQAHLHTDMYLLASNVMERVSRGTDQSGRLREHVIRVPSGLNVSIVFYVNPGAAQLVHYAVPV